MFTIYMSQTKLKVKLEMMEMTLVLGIGQIKNLMILLH